MIGPAPRVAVPALSRSERSWHVSERRACAALGQHRSTQRKVPRGRDDEQRLTADIIELARQYGRYGHRKVAELRSHSIVGVLSMAICFSGTQDPLSGRWESVLYSGGRSWGSAKNSRCQLLQTLPRLAVSCAAPGGQCSFGDTPS